MLGAIDSARRGASTSERTDDYAAARERMVRRHIEARGVASAAVLRAMRAVPRHLFVPERLLEAAYDDGPLPIGEGQTISQPYIVAVMCEALELEGSGRALEIGTGSGYAAAVLGEIADEVYTIERIEALAERSRAVLAQLGYDNVTVRCGDGTIGWAEHAPFDGIVVTAGGPRVPESLSRQLAIGGRLVIPVGSVATSQELVRVRRTGPDEFDTEPLGAVRFVPLIGDEAWSPQLD